MHGSALRSHGQRAIERAPGRGGIPRGDRRIGRRDECGQVGAGGAGVDRRPAGARAAADEERSQEVRGHDEREGRRDRSRSPAPALTHEAASAP